MKDSNTTYIIIGIIILFAAGYFLFQSNNSPSSTITDTLEDIEDNSFDEAPNDSVDQQEINNEVKETETTNKPSLYATTLVAKTNQMSDEVFTTSFNNYTELFPGIFTLGTYYIENINKKGVEACKGKEAGSEDDDRKYLDYSKDNFKLKKIVYQNKQVFLMIDSLQIPENECARIFQRPLGNSPFNAIHLIVE